MKTHKVKSAKITRRDAFTRTEANFVVSMIRKTQITPQLLAAAEHRATRSRDARSATFLEKYRLKVAA